jgi:ClpP class serine protease
VAEVDDRTLILADIATKALRQVSETVQQILQVNGMGDEPAKAIAEQLSTGKWTHDYPLHLEMVKNLGLTVSDHLTKEVFDLMALYPQPMHGQPSVQYIPIPYEQTARRLEQEPAERR